jgi:DNA-binding CsgD family transcriptional regulator
VEADALNTLGYVVTTAQSVESGLTLIAQAAERALAAGDAHQQMRALWNTFCSLLEAAEWQRALDAFTRADAELPRLGQDHLLPELWGYAVEVLWRTGRWQEAQDRLVEARRRFTTSDRRATNIDLLIGLGRFDEARREIEAAIERNVYTDFESQGWLRISRATIEAWEGHSEAARRDVDAALADLVGLDLPLAIANAVTVGLRVEADAAANARLRGAASDELTAISRSDDLSKVARELMGRPGPADGWKRESGAMAIQCEAEVTRVRGRSDPPAWERSVVAWDELSMPYHAAYSRLRAAESHVSAPSDRLRASVLLDEALRAATALGAEPLRQAIGALALRARIDVGGFDTDVHASIGLTSRELEVLRLLSGGATNRQIATSLYISDKTASVHVSNIIRKLGVSNRSEATATAIRRGLA